MPLTKEPLTKSIGERIRSRREQGGWSQRKLAEKVGTSQTTVSAWEHGSIPSWRNLKALSMVLEVSREWLRTGQGTQRGRSPDFLEDSIFNAAYVLFEETYRDLGINLPLEIKCQASKIFFQDAMDIGPQCVTRERAEAILRIASPKILSTREEEPRPSGAGNGEVSGVPEGASTTNPIRKARLDAGMLQKDLASALNIDQASLSSMEREGHQPSQHSIDRVLAAIHSLKG